MEIYKLLKQNQFLNDKEKKYLEQYSSDIFNIFENKEKEEKFFKYNHKKFLCGKYNDIKLILDKYCLYCCYITEDFAKFKYVIKEYSLDTNILEYDYRYKLYKRLNFWLKKFCDKYYFDNVENMKFLLDYKADKKIIIEQIEKSIETINFNKFMFFVENFKDEYLRININNKFQKQIDEWIETFCRSEKERNIKFLLKQYIEGNKENALKISLIRGNFKSFKNLVEEENVDLKVIRKDIDNKLQNRLDEWLKEICDKKYYNKKKKKENIEFLLKAGAKKEIIYKHIKNSVINNNFDKLKYFAGHFQKYEICIKSIIKDSKTKEKVCSMLLSNIKEETDFVVDQLSKIKEIKCENEDAIKTLISSIYNKDNGLGTQTLENKIMRPEIFEEKTKELIIKIVKEINPSRANILRRLLKVKI